MSLQYRTEVYIRKAIRQAEFEHEPSRGWAASLPVFGLAAAGESKGDAEEQLLIRLTAAVLSAISSGRQLPVAEGIDLNVPSEEDDGDQTWFWTPEWQAGEAEASRDIAEGRIEVFESAEDFLAAFED